jgi:hypothetical protein
MRRKGAAALIRKALAGDSAAAVVEAAIFFPIIFMIFAGLALLSMYLPERAILQRAVQYTAAALATERSDTWIYYDEENLSYGWYGSKAEMPLDKRNVYAALFKAIVAGEDGQAEPSVRNLEQKANILLKLENYDYSTRFGGDGLDVRYEMVNYIVYKEISVTATRTIPMPVDLSFVMFPKELTITVTSTAVVQNGDEFVRNVDLAVDFVDYLREKYPGVDNIFNKITEAGGKIGGFLGI